jgi:Sulfotransferase family
VPRPTRYVTLLRNPVERAISLYYHLNLKISLEEFIRRPPYREADNGQTRRISGDDPEVGQCTAAMLRRAKENLRDRFALVGVTERFEETALHLKRVMGWTKEINCYPKNRNPNRIATSSVSNQVVDLIQRHEAYDIELYGYALELLRAATAAQDVGFWSEVEELKA